MAETGQRFEPFDSAKFRKVVQLKLERSKVILLSFENNRKKFLEKVLGRKLFLAICFPQFTFIACRHVQSCI